MPENIMLTRYQKAISRCGGALMLTTLPKAVKDILKGEKRLSVKVILLEEIADRLSKK